MKALESKAVNRAWLALCLSVLGCGDFGMAHIVPATHEAATLSGEIYTRGNYTGQQLYLPALKEPYRVEKRPEIRLKLTNSWTPPYEGTVRAFVLKGHEVVTEMDSLGDLRGYVDIDSAEEAIEYVRLRTSDQTYFLFRPRILVEVSRRSSILGIEVAKCAFGVVPAPFFDRHRLAQLQIRREADHFVINRFVVMTLWPGAEGYPNPPSLHRLTERVFTDGRYEVEEELTLEDLDFADVPYPLEPR